METKDYIEQKMKEVCVGESLTVEEVIHFVGFVQMMIVLA